MRFALRDFPGNFSRSLLPFLALTTRPGVIYAVVAELRNGIKYPRRLRRRYSHRNLLAYNRARAKGGPAGERAPSCVDTIRIQRGG